MKWFELAEDVLIVKGLESASAKAIRGSSIEGILDVVETDHEIAIQHSLNNIDGLISQLKNLQKITKIEKEYEVFNVPVCYDLGLDWEDVKEQTGLGIDEMIELHSKVEYKASYGFIPGFLYLSGLDKALECIRRENPRERIPAGAIGIGGNKTGIYSLESPGGWQIIGRTPLSLFDVQKSTPFSIPNGAKIRFNSISKKQFDDWG